MFERDYGVEVAVAYFVFMIIIIITFAYCCSSDLMIQVRQNGNFEKIFHSFLIQDCRTPKLQKDNAIPV